MHKSDIWQRTGDRHRSVAGSGRALWALVILVAVTFAWAHAPQARAAVPPGSGAGVYALDKTSYSTLEGTAVTVGVNATGAGTLTQDIVVTLQLTAPTVDANNNPIYPNSTVTQTITFKAGTIPSFGFVQFQTLNYNRIVDTVIGVNIISVSGGGGLNPAGPTFAPITVLGLGTPRVTNVEPHSGSNISPNAVTLTITGQNFRLGSPAGTPCTTASPTPPFVACTLAVRFTPLNNPSATNDFPGFTILSPNQISIPAPSTLTLGTTYDVRVVIEDPTGQSPGFASVSPVSPGDQFTPTSGPTITNIFSASGPVTGGALVTVTGTLFTGCPTSVVFKNLTTGFTAPANMSTCTAISASQFSIRAPAVPTAQTVNVVATFPGGTTIPTDDSVFTYTGSPVITSITPQFGPASGGTQVTINGTGFQGILCPNPNAPPAASVMFGATPALACTFVSPTQITAIAPPGTGTQQIQVTSSYTASSFGTSAFTTAANYTYVSGPIISSISPASGPPGGGTLVTINGSGFAAGATVKFGITPATFVTVVSATQITATAPAGIGTVDVTVGVGGLSSPSGAADLFSYSAPTVTSVLPNAGPIAGGTPVQINGTNFTSDAVVFFGTTQVPTTFISPIMLQAVSPPSTSVSTTMVDVTVHSTAGTSATSANDAFTYTNGPIIASLNPATGGTSGGVPVVITGTNFIQGATVMFGTTPSTAVNVNSVTQITALSPSVSAAGVVDVRVTTSAGVTPVSPQDQFTYTSSAPVVTGVNPPQGLVSGGTTITITGLGFTGALCSGVVFGTVPAASCTVNSDTSITAVSPPNPAGPSYLTVTTPNGTSAIVQNYTYLTISAGSGGSSGGGPASGGNAQLPPPTGAPVSYALSFRWTLIVWRGADGASIATALKGTTGADLTNDVGVVFTWDNANARWHGYFTGYGAIPGASDLTTFSRGGVYWIALNNPGTVTLTGTDG